MPTFSENDGPGPPRDIVGYGRHVPRVTWPNGARVAVSVVLNWEEGSEYSQIAGDGRNEGLAEIPYVMDAQFRDLAAESVYEYGARAGVWRLQRLFDEFKIPVTFFGAAIAFERNPEVAEYLREAGHEPCSHGWRWEEVWTLSRDEEREHMLEAIRSIEQTCGQRPQGWYCRYGPSVNTRELLVEEGGFVYDSDAYNDDLPYYVQVGDTRHLIVPYSFTYNDGRYVLPQGFSDPSSFFDQCRRGLDELWEEGATHPRMMSIGLHSRWAGQAGRTSGLRDFLEYAHEKGDVWFARRIDIAEWWHEHHEEFPGPMKAVRFHEYGDADVLRLEDVPEPQPGPGEVVIRVRAVGLNHVDIDMRAGTSRLPLTLPHTLGFEAGGDIAAVGPGVEDLAEGDRVTPLYQVACRHCEPCLAGRQQFCRRLQMLGVTRAGGYAEYVLAPADSVVRLPDAMTYEQAASTQTTFATAWHCLVTRARVRAGETVLVSAAGSGVGSSGIQVAKRAGARVIASAGSDEKLALAREIGADVAISYSEDGFSARVREATDGKGVDVVLEHVGGSVFERSLAAVAEGGRVVVCGGHAGEVVDLDLIELFRHEWSVIGCARATEAELRHVVELVGRGELTPVVSQVLPLAEAAAAHRLMEDRRQFGKVVLTP